MTKSHFFCVCKCSMCCRDSFQNVVELLDDMFQRAAAAEEPHDMNWIRTHAQALQRSGQDTSASAARLFSNPAGDYGSMVNERVGASNWSDSKVRSCAAAYPAVPLSLPALTSSTFQSLSAWRACAYHCSSGWRHLPKKVVRARREVPF